MKIQQTQIEIDSETLEIQIDAEILPEEIQGVYDRFYLQIQKDLKLPGFARGQVPLETVRRQSSLRVRDQAYREIMQEFGKKALVESGFFPEEGMHGWSAESSDLHEGQSFRLKARFYFPSSRTDNQIHSELGSLPEGDEGERRLFELYSLARRSDSNSLKMAVGERVLQVARNLRRDLVNPAIHSSVTIMAVWERCQDLCKMVLELVSGNDEAQALLKESQKHISPRV
jgi:hypothetical protein